MSPSGLSGTRETQNYCWESSKGPLRWWEDWSIFHMRPCWKSFHLEKKKLREIHVCEYLKGGYKEDRSRIFSVIASDRTRGKGHKLIHRRCSMNIRNHCEGDCIVTGCPGNFWILQWWIYSEVICRWSCAAKCRWCYLDRVVDPMTSNPCVAFP